jgi:hypothetical protein
MMTSSTDYRESGMVVFFCPLRDFFFLWECSLRDSCDRVMYAFVSRRVTQRDARKPVEKAYSVYCSRIYVFI